MKRSKSRMHSPDWMRRRRAIFNSDSGDRISALPDAILGIILSFLPTMEAVATSVLSKRWKFAWVTVHNLDICFKASLEELNEGENMKFVEFVDRVLLLHDVGFLNKFSLLWHPQCISSHASSWISTAIAKNPHDLSLSIQTSYGPFEMPINVFSCDSLRSLELDGDISVSAAMSVFLPRLESLKLGSVNFESEESFENLISGCPMLKYLCLDYMETGVDVYTCIISSVSLIRLEMYYYFECILKLNTSSLEYLKVIGGVSEIFVQTSLSSLVEVDLRISLDNDFSNNSIVEAIRAFHCAKSLKLCGNTMQGLSRATISLSTEFKRLVKLQTSTYCCDCISLRDFIQCSDNLQVVTIYQEQGEIGHVDHSKWTTLVEVPRCLSNSLKEVAIKSREFYDKCDMIGYILEHGSALETMKISCGRGIIVHDIVTYLSKFSIASPDCHVDLS